MKKYFALFLSLATAIVFAQKEGEMSPYFTDNAFGAGVGTTMHPVGEYCKGTTYVAFQGAKEDSFVAAYNHKTKKWIGPFKAGVSVLGKDPNVKIDNHGKPALIIDGEGYIHVIFGGHGGLPIHGTNPLGNTHGGKMIHVVSKKPLDITSWEVLDNIPAFGTYNQLVKMDNGDIYLFYRHGAHRSNWVYQKSTDNARTFAAPVSILKTKRRTDGPAEDAWYGWFEKGPNNQIICCFNYHHCKDENVGHDGERHNGYYMSMNTKNGMWTNVEGKKLNTPLTKEDADAYALVVDTKDKWTVRGTAALDHEGNPHITITQGEHMGLRHGGPKNIHHYKWTGKKWTEGNAKLPIATGDFLMNSKNKIKLLLASNNAERTGEVAWWTSKDDGETFKKGKVLLHRKKRGFRISSMIKNAQPEARALVITKMPGSDYGRMFLIGDDGPVERLKSEAIQLTKKQKKEKKKK